MPPPAELQRRLGLADAAALYVGNILGSGIFVAPAAVAAAAAGAAPGAALWALGGALAGCGALCYAECGARLPRPGGFYVFYREVYGLPVAFVGGWAALLVTYPASIAAIALVFARYVEEAIPGLRAPEAAIAASALLAVGALNAIGVRTAAWAQRLLTGVKAAALAAVCLAAVLASGAAPGPPAGAPPGPDPASAPAGGGPFPAGLAGILAAMVVLLWTYDGWSDLALVAGEVRDPGRNLGRAVLLGTALLVALYAAVQAAVGALLPPDRAAASGRVVAEAVESGLGPGSARMTALLVTLTTFGSIHGIVLASSRLGYAMARDGVFFRWFGAVHPSFGTPARSVAAVAAASVVYVLAAGFRNLLAFFSFGVWIFYALTAAALLVLRRRGAGGPRAWRAPGGLVPPLVVIATGACMSAGLMVENPARSLAGLGLLLAGFPAYVLWRRAAARAG